MKLKDWYKKLTLRHLYILTFVFVFFGLLLVYIENENENNFIDQKIENAISIISVGIKQQNRFLIESLLLNLLKSEPRINGISLLHNGRRLIEYGKLNENFTEIFNLTGFDDYRIEIHRANTPTLKLVLPFILAFFLLVIYLIIEGYLTFKRVSES